MRLREPSRWAAVKHKYAHSMSGQNSGQFRGDCHCERQFEDRLHGRVRGRIEVAIQRRAGQRTGDGYLAVSVGSDGTNLLLEGLLGDRGSGKQEKN